MLSEPRVLLGTLLLFLCFFKILSDEVTYNFYQKPGKKRLISNAKPFQNRGTNLLETVGPGILEASYVNHSTELGTSAHPPHPAPNHSPGVATSPTHRPMPSPMVVSGLCSALNPAIVARGVLEQADLLGVDINDVKLVTGGEDMPDAYLSCPTAPGDLANNLIEIPPGIMAKHRTFVIVYALRFGFRSSVNIFTSFSVFFQSVARPVAALMLSMFYDDASLIDLDCARGEGQARSPGTGTFIARLTGRGAWGTDLLRR